MLYQWRAGRQLVGVAHLPDLPANAPRQQHLRPSAFADYARPNGAPSASAWPSCHLRDWAAEVKQPPGVAGHGSSEAANCGRRPIEETAAPIDED
jgi:hypothetical protein